MSILYVKDKDGNLAPIITIKGQDGSTPYIQDGYWHINGVSTGVKAEGVDGKDGEDCENVIDKISSIDTWHNDAHSLDDCDGLSWVDEFAFYDSEDNEIKTGTIYHRVPIVAGQNISIVPDDGSGNFIINATGSTDDGGLMPTIRYANAQTSNGTWIIDENNTLTFTVEITGGKVQEGDMLQICCKRMYKKGVRKIWRLRAMENQYITAQDIDKRFLGIDIYGGKRNILWGWLFRNDRIPSTDTLSYIYFRIKRVTKYDDDGGECDAIFSNVEKVAKTYDFATKKLTIK